MGLPLLAVLVAILAVEPQYGIVDDATLLGYAHVTAADFPGEWANRVWSDVSSWGMVRPFYWAPAYAEYSAGAESPIAFYIVNWAATGAVLAFAGFAIARAFRVPRDRLARRSLVVRQGHGAAAKLSVRIGRCAPMSRGYRRGEVAGCMDAEP